MMARRTLLSRLMMVSAAAAIPAAAAAECPPPTVPSVSPIMNRLIADFTMTAIRFNAVDVEGDAEGFKEASDARAKALIDLTFHAPESLIDHAAKLACLIEFIEDTERFALRVCVEDASRLVEGL